MSTNSRIISSENQCWCGKEISGHNLVDLEQQRLKDWFATHREQLLAAITNRERDRLLLPRIDARLFNLAQQLRLLEKKYQLPHQRVSARDLVAFCIKYPLDNRVYDYQYREHRHSPIRDLDGEPLGGKTPNGEPQGGQEFIEISHSYEPKMYDVRFYLEREIDMAVRYYNQIDRRNYYREFRYDLALLVPKGFPASEHLHCIYYKLMAGS